MKSKPFSVLHGVLLVIVALSITTASPAKDLTDPKEILQKADDAAKAVKAVSYEGQFERIGPRAAEFPTIKGTVLMTGWRGGPEKYRIDANVKRPGSSEDQRILLGGDGKTFFAVDHEAKKIYEDIDPGVVGSFGRLGMALVMAEFVHATPFSDELAGKEVELVGSASVVGEDCYQIRVRYGRFPQEAQWYFSKKDFLPRRADRMFLNEEGQPSEAGGTRLVVSKLVADPKLDDDAFKTPALEGYEKTDDWAP